MLFQVQQSKIIYLFNPFEGEVALALMDVYESLVYKIPIEK